MYLYQPHGYRSRSDSSSESSNTSFHSSVSEASTSASLQEFLTSFYPEAFVSTASQNGGSSGEEREVSVPLNPTTPLLPMATSEDVETEVSIPRGFLFFPGGSFSGTIQRPPPEVPENAVASSSRLSPPRVSHSYIWLFLTSYFFLFLANVFLQAS